MKSDIVFLICVIPFLLGIVIGVIRFALVHRNIDRINSEDNGINVWIYLGMKNQAREYLWKSIGFGVLASIILFLAFISRGIFD